MDGTNLSNNRLENGAANLNIKSTLDIVPAPLRISQLSPIMEISSPRPISKTKSRTILLPELERSYKILDQKLKQIESGKNVHLNNNNSNLIESIADYQVLEPPLEFRDRPAAGIMEISCKNAIIPHESLNIPNTPDLIDLPHNISISEDDSLTALMNEFEIQEFEPIATLVSLGSSFDEATLNQEKICDNLENSFNFATTIERLKADSLNIKLNQTIKQKTFIEKLEYFDFLRHLYNSSIQEFCHTIPGSQIWNTDKRQIFLGKLKDCIFGLGCNSDRDQEIKKIKSSEASILKIIIESDDDDKTQYFERVSKICNKTFFVNECFLEMLHWEIFCQIEKE